MKNREQTYYILGALVLIAVLFFGFDTKPSTQKALEKSRALNAPGIDIQSLLADAKEKIQPEQLNLIEAMESQIHFAADSAKINLLQQLSGYWYELGEPILAGIYARQIAEQRQDAESWSIAGTTFAAALDQTGLEEEDKIAARGQAIDAFEHAISLEPDAIENRINQALCYIELPDATEPMKGIQMLAALANSNPESALPKFHLARLALQTGQIDRAQERIEQALALDSTNSRIACLAIDIYSKAGKPGQAKRWSPVCASMN